MKRRDAIKALGALAGAASSAKFLTACDEGAGENAGITNYVFLMMENRSYDHYLGARAFAGMAGDGLLPTMTNPDLDGTPVAVYRTRQQAMCVAADPPHGWDASRLQRGDGENDGFVIAHQNSHGRGAVEPMSYMLRQDIPVHWALADAYTSCDRWFSSVLGPTLPNRMYWHAGTANGATTNDAVLGGAFEGVDTVYHRLESVGIDWNYYYSDVPVLSIAGHINTEGRIHRLLYDFIDHAAAGTLKPVSYIDPGFGINDDHPPHHPLLGQQLIATVYQALAESPQWNNILLVVTYDENGGFFDHVPPPTAADDLASQGFNQLGFRVPTLVVGPYVKQNYVSSVPYDHTSALKHLQDHFGLAPLTKRVSEASNLMDCIDVARLEAGEPAPPIQLPAVEIDASSLPASCQGAHLGPGPAASYPHELIAWADRTDKLGSLDLRHESRDYLSGIADYLETRNLGRLRRDR